MKHRTLIRTCALLIAPIIVLAGCQVSKSNRGHIPSPVTIDKPVEGRPTLQMPLDLPESDVRLVPFTVDRVRGWFEESDQFGMADSIQLDQSSKPRFLNQQVAAMEFQPLPMVGMARSIRWHNAVFQPREGEGWLALEERGMLSRFEIIGAHKRATNIDFAPHAILLTATVEDTNGDGALTSRDADVLLIGDKDGRGMHKITPPGTKVWDKLYHQEEKVLMLMVARDSNGDGQFTADDSAEPYVFNIGSAGTAKPLVDPGLSKRAEELLKN